MAGFWKRQLNVLGNLDRAVASEFTSDDFRTLSGLVGRACGYGSGTKTWWGPPLRFLIEIMPCFGPGHCQRWAEREDKEAAALQSAGLL